jgi:uncharacterized protein YdaU (DUF1376 family)
VNYFSFHIGDYATHTRHLSLMEDLAYRRMLDLYYTTEKPLPDAAQTARLIGMRDHVEEVAAVLADFFTASEAGHTQTRCDDEIDRYHKKADSARSANQKRWGSDRLLKSDATQIPTKNQEPITKEVIQNTSCSPGLAAPDPAPEPSIACPTTQIVAMFHDRLPMLPRVVVVSENRKRAISGRWREVLGDHDIRKAPDPKAAALEWFDWFFGYVASSRFLTGKDKDWRADIDFLMNPAKFARVVEGTYHKEHA